MKKAVYLLFCAVLMLSGCQQRDYMKPSEINAARGERPYYTFPKLRQMGEDKGIFETLTASDAYAVIRVSDFPYYAPTRSDYGLGPEGMDEIGYAMGDAWEGYDEYLLEVKDVIWQREGTPTMQSGQTYTLYDNPLLGDTLFFLRVGGDVIVPLRFWGEGSPYEGGLAIGRQATFYLLEEGHVLSVLYNDLDKEFSGLDIAAFKGDVAGLMQEAK